MKRLTRNKKKADKSDWIVGGGLFIGMGVGFFFLQESALAFVACLFIGLGLGLFTSAILSRVRS